MSAILDALADIEKASNRVTRKIDEDRVVTVSDGQRIIQQFELLKASIEQSFGSIANAPIEVKEAFARAEAQRAATLPAKS